MNARVRAALAALVFALVCVGRAAPVGAHRLDEYLQATRLSVAFERVTLEIDLTAGTGVAPAVFAMLDVDRSGAISAAEGDAYARQIIDSVVLTVDGRTLRPALESALVPTTRDLSDGVGVIHVLASAPIPVTRPGDHRLFFRNTHRAEMSVYLANALVPSDSRIEVTGQRRDGGQHELTIDYRVAPAASSLAAGAWRFVAGLGLAALLGMALWRRPRFTRLVRSARR